MKKMLRIIGIVLIPVLVSLLLPFRISHAAANITVSYSNADDTIEVRPATSDLVTFTLSDIADKLSNKSLLQKNSGQWVLRANLLIKGDEDDSSDLHLEIENETLRLKSDAEGFVWLKIFNADATIRDASITSINGSGDFDENISDGRAFILAKYNSILDIFDSEIGYLGYPAGESYGLSWRVPLGDKDEYRVTGTVEGSDIHHNYYGIYTHSAEEMVFRGNQIRNNISYGLDPHDDSNNFLVEDNDAFENGRHGIIFSKRCENNIIRNNRSFNNFLTGIMLDKDSNNNIVENNTTYGNINGIALYGSSKNTVRNNTVYENDRGILAKDNSENNTIEGNTVTDQFQYGIYFYNGAENNTIEANEVSTSLDWGIYLKTPSNEVLRNTLTGNTVGIYLFGNDASGNILDSNTIAESLRDGIVIKQGGNNKLEKNEVLSSANHGIVLRNSAENILAENLTSENGNHGIYLYDGSRKTLIEDNESSANGGRGIYLKGSDANTIRNNTTEDNASYGIFAFDSSENEFSGDTILGNFRDFYYGKEGADNTVYVDNERIMVKVSDSASSFKAISRDQAVLENNRGLETTITPETAFLENNLASREVWIDPALLWIIPQSGSGKISLTSWHDEVDGTKQWQGTFGNALIRIGGLTPGGNYRFLVNGAEVSTHTADSAGEVQFNYDGGNAKKSYEIK